MRHVRSGLDSFIEDSCGVDSKGLNYLELPRLRETAEPGHCGRGARRQGGNIGSDPFIDDLSSIGSNGFHGRVRQW